MLAVLQKVGPRPNPFVTEAISYVEKDLAIRDQQANWARELNKPDADYPWYGG